MEEDVNDGYEHKKEDFDGDLDSTLFLPSVESKSCGESISELQVDLEKELVREIVNETVKVNSLCGVVKDSSVGNVIGESNLGPILDLVSENPILNPNSNNGNSPRTSPNVSLRISRKGGILTDEESRSNAMFSFNKVKLGEMRIANEDSMMQEDDSAKKSVSFMNDVQGIRGNGNNKLRRIPVSIDERGKKRVDMDPLIE
uniref:Uncharacterized protein n=1 Tax=Tanacetum cinerariifolium TaxID=118510 RepID=A0A6L2K5N4_TANCI|nr:hypothetical protein [Tanacetum cinerariifolium]